MEIKLIRDGSRISANFVDAELNGHFVPFVYDCPNDFWAKLLCNLLQQRMYKHLERIRQNAYDRGWRDKASHKRIKKLYFTGSWDYKDV